MSIYCLIESRIETKAAPLFRYHSIIAMIDKMELASSRILFQNSARCFAIAVMAQFLLWYSLFERLILTVTKRKTNSFFSFFSIAPMHLGISSAFPIYPNTTSSIGLVTLFLLCYILLFLNFVSEASISAMACLRLEAYFENRSCWRLDQIFSFSAEIVTRIGYLSIRFSTTGASG